MSTMSAWRICRPMAWISSRSAGRRQRLAFLVIDADHLLRMAVLGPADVAFLDRAGPVGVDQDRLVVDAVIEQHLADAAAVGVGADDAGQGRLGAEGAEHGGDAAGAAEPLLAPVGVQQDDRRFLADALGVAPDVAVEHQVADDQHARLAQLLHQVDQVGGHRRSPDDFLLRSAPATLESAVIGPHRT